MNKDTKLADMKHQLDEVLAMHARILSLPPVHVEAAYATILRIGATLARESRLAGKDLADAVEKIKRYLAQERAANDTLTARVAELEAAQPEQLAKAWAKYTELFGAPPHGTVKQLAAMLELIPKRDD